jgi:hypothetical protein
MHSPYPLPILTALQKFLFIANSSFLTFHLSVRFCTFQRQIFLVVWLVLHACILDCYNARNSIADPNQASFLK